MTIRSREDSDYSTTVSKERCDDWNDSHRNIYVKPKIKGTIRIDSNQLSVQISEAGGKPQDFQAGVNFLMDLDDLWSDLDLTLPELWSPSSWRWWNWMLQVRIWSLDRSLEIAGRFHVKLIGEERSGCRMALASSGLIHLTHPNFRAAPMANA